MSLQEIIRIIRLYGKKISQLGNATLPLDGTEKVEIVQAGVNVQIDVSALGVTSSTTQWIHRGDWDLSANTLPSPATGYSTYYITAPGNVDFGTGAELVPIGTILVSLVANPTIGAEWRSL